MAVIALNADEALPPGLIACAASLAPGAPVIVMIHGYRFAPGHRRSDPHRDILGLGAAGAAAARPGPRRNLSWPRALGFSADGPEGLGISFGWPARGRLSAAYARAGVTGQGLAPVLARLADAAARPVHLIAHSLGARVALQALAAAPGASIGRMVLMAGAELRPLAGAAIDSPAGRQAEVINVTSRENDPFDFALEWLIGRGRHRALGFGLEAPRRNWLDLQIDAPETRAGLAALGFGIGADVARACHWSPYLREGLFDFYRIALSQGWALPMGLLRANIPARQAPRWSRLLHLPGRAQSS
ncbi:MAG: hypothetical protein Q4G26_12625, partial [Paracoccus sp. (in: a-proteobacteria)]|nr:hypothetical protein [Paracoccus sp. (in: a-proteobacteria)]